MRFRPSVGIRTSSSWYITKQTKHIFYVSILTSVVILGLLRWWVPQWQVHGAAAAVACTQVVGCLATYRIAQKIFPVVLEWRKLMATGAALAIAYLLAQAVPGDGLAHFVLNGTVLASFLGMLMLFGVFGIDERRALAQWLSHRRVNPEAVSS